MQTFLPYADFDKSLKCLDRLRLGKQRVEAKQLIKSMVLEDPSLLGHLHPSASTRLVDSGTILDMVDAGKLNHGWKNHPAREMWRGHIGALAIYHDTSIVAWKLRGHVNNMPFLSAPGKHELPVWFGDEEFHNSHKSNLLRKDPLWYGQLGWEVPNDLEYVWPTREQRFRLV